ncbi:MAG: Na/Pi cotransporter family protein [Lachnospiraceae bacterium]|nr:Na/Pi cotransporter family protein [Lachnospiraceae bacterium]
MGISEIVQLLCGIALFLFGMSLMGDGLKKLSGNKLEPVLYRLSNTRPKAVLLGTGVTAVIQSSCATAVMVVGFVNSGMMKVVQGINIILGAILGTSITGWILCLSYIEGGGELKALLSTSTLTGIVAVIGISLRTFGKRQVVKNTGDILLGFSVLMIGMNMMSGAVGGLGDSPAFIKTLSSFSNPLLGILVGALFTALLQSVSAAVGILQALSVTGAMTFESALPLLLGVAIGAAAPVLLSSFGANIEGKRTAFIYPIAATLGVMFFSSIYYTADSIVHFAFRDTVMTPFNIAFINTVMRLIIVIFLMPFTDIVESLVNMLITDRGKEERLNIHLEERFIPYPALAIEQSRRTVNEMARISGKALGRALSLFDDYMEPLYKKISEAESDVDRYEDAVSKYLVRLTTRQELTRQQNEKIALFLLTLSDMERISDHALNLAGSAKEVTEKNVMFSKEARSELSELFSLIRKETILTTEAFTEDDLFKAEQIGPLNTGIEAQCEKMKNNHIERLQRNECTIQHGFIFNDITTFCERVSNHCDHIATALINNS